MVWKLDNVNSFKKDITAYIVKKYDNQTAALIDNKTAEFTRNEVENLDKALLAIFKNDESTLKVCEFVFEGALNGYNGDFTAEKF